MKKNLYSRFTPLFISSVIAASLFVTVSAAPGGTPPQGNVDANFNTVTAERGAFSGLLLRKTQKNDDAVLRIENPANQGYGISAVSEVTAGHFENRLTPFNRVYLATPQDALSAVGRIRSSSTTTAEAGYFQHDSSENRVRLATPTDAINAVGNVTISGRLQASSASIVSDTTAAHFEHRLNRNSVDLGSSNYALNANGNVNVNGHLQATSIGSYITRTANFSVPTGASITYSNGTPCQTNEQPIACGYDIPRGTPFDTFHILGQQISGNQCTTNANNTSGRTIRITTSTLCFNPNS